MPHCSLCSGKLEQFLDFGDVALAGAFLESEQCHEEKYPLSLGFCKTCFGVELMEKVDVVFRQTTYHSSTIPRLRDHFRKYAEVVNNRFKPKTVIEIGCNDGVMLKHLTGNVIGVDPSEAAKDVAAVNDYWNVETASKLPKADVIVANNVFAHIIDIQGATRAIKDRLADNGVFVFEVHSLAEMLDKTQYDWCYHEHMYYYSLLALSNHFQRHDMRIFDVENIPLHGGSRRYYVCKDDRPSMRHVEAMKQWERWHGLNQIARFRKFAENVASHRDMLKGLFKRLSGKRIIGYGASGRANTVIQYCDLKLDYIVDDSPARQGLFTPGSHIPIRGKADEYDYAVVFAWTYLGDIAKKCHHMIVPFPMVKVVGERMAA